MDTQQTRVAAKLLLRLAAPVFLICHFSLTAQAQDAAKGPEAAVQPASGPAAEWPLTDAQGDPLPPGAIMRLGSMRWQPGGYIQFLAFAPDGKRLASWHEEHYTTAALTMWDVPTGREVWRFHSDAASIRRPRRRRYGNSSSGQDGNRARCFR